MQRTALTIFGALLISGSVVQMAAASEHHRHLSKAYFGRYLSDYRGAYNQVNGPINGSATVRAEHNPVVAPLSERPTEAWPSSEGYMSSGPAGH